MIYVFGHKNPDTDSIVSAVAYAELLKRKGIEAKAVALGEPNEETKYLFELYGVQLPEVISSVAGKKVILVDHNEKEQSADDLDAAEIVEVIDHHKIKFSYPKPIKFHTEPLGSTATIITKKFILEKEEIPHWLAGLLLGAILSDTAIFKSPTTTNEDKEIARFLAEKAGVDDVVSFGIQLLKKKAKVPENLEELVTRDSKTYEWSGKKVLIGQFESVDISELLTRETEIFGAMRRVKEREGYFAVVLMLTDVMKEGTELFVVADDLEPFRRAFGKQFEKGHEWLPGVLSRKKQIVPPLEKAFS